MATPNETGSNPREKVSDLRRAGRSDFQAMTCPYQPASGHLAACRDIDLRSRGGKAILGGSAERQHGLLAGKIDSPLFTCTSSRHRRLPGTYYLPIFHAVLSPTRVRG